MFGRNPPMRPDQQLQPTTRAGTGPAPQTDVIRAREVIVSGPNGGIFVYNSTRTMLEASLAGAATTDPILGVTVPAGFATYNSHGKVINLLSTTNNAFFQYLDAGAVQGQLILSVASTSGTDPVTSGIYSAGMEGQDTVGGFLLAIGPVVEFGEAIFSFQSQIKPVIAGSSTVNPYLLVNAPEQSAAGHLQMLLQGFSPDGTTSPPQLLIGTVSGSATLTPVSTAGMEVQGGSGLPVMQLQASASNIQAINTKVAADTNNRFQVRADGLMNWGSGAAPADSSMSRGGANLLNVSTADLSVHTAGRGLRVAEGSNAKQGVSTLTAGTVVVANTSVTASSRIHLTAQDNNSTGALRVSARTAGTSFTITSSNAGDSGVVGWEIFEPG